MSSGGCILRGKSAEAQGRTWYKHGANMTSTGRRKSDHWRPRLDSRNHAIPILENLSGPPITKRQRRLLETMIRLRCCLVHKTHSKGNYKFTSSPCLLENPQHKKIGCDRYLQTIVLTLSQPPQRSDKPTYTLCTSNFSKYRGLMFVT